MERLRLLLPLAFSLLIGIMGTLYLEPDSYSFAGDTIATFAGFVAAAVVPATILAATLLRTSGIDLNKLDSYRKAINQQLNYLFAVLMIATAIVIFIIIGKLTQWQNYSLLINYKYKIYLQTSNFLNFFISFLLSLLIIRFWGFFTAVKGMFSFHASTILKEMEDKQSKELDNLFPVNELPKDTRANFGKKINLNSPSDNTSSKKN